jgi:iron complex outermembrane receptor protein
VCKFIIINILAGISVPTILVAQTDSVKLEQVEIIGKKNAVSPTQSMVELSGKELDRSRGMSLGETLQKLPGVTVLQTGPSIFKPVVQGMYGQRVLIMNNGVRQEGQQWGSEHAPEVDVFLASKLSVIKGASSVRYGSDAIGGVILVDPKPLRKQAGIGGEINLAGFSNNRAGVASGIIDYSPKQITGLSARIQGTFRKAGNSKTPDYYLKNTGFEEYNFSYGLGYLKRKAGIEIFYSQFNTKLGIFSASHIGNLTDLKRAIASPVPLESSGFSYAIGRPYQQVSHELWKASAYLKTARGNKFILSYAFQYNDRKEYDKHRPLNDSLAAQNNPELELHITTHTGNLSYEHSLIKNVSGTIGIAMVSQGNIFKGRYFIPNFKSYAGGIFLIEQWQKKKWLVEVGVRYDYKWVQAFYYKNKIYQDPQFSFANFSGSMGATYLLTENLKLRANAGTAFRPPHISELFSNGLHHGAAAVENGDETLKSERAYNFSLSVNLQSGRLAGEVNAYYTYIHNYIYLAPVFPATLTIRGAFPTFQYTQIEATFAGVDLWLSDSLNRHFTVLTKASLVYAYNNTIKDRLILTPASRFENAIIYNFTMGKKINQPYIGISNTIVLRKRNLPDSSDYAPAPAGYTLLNMQMGFSLKMGKQTMDINFSCNNLMNEKYRDYLDRFRYYADAIGRNFIVRVKMTF